MKIASMGPGGYYHTRLLTPPDLPSLQALFERAGDYFELATGRPPAKDEAPRAFVAGPPAKSVNDKRVIGILTAEDELAGVLDALTDWPAEGIWTMGMLLLDPAHRERGLGTAVLQAYETWAATQGATAFRTALGSHHERGLHFAQNAGYQRESTLAEYDAGARRATIVFLTKRAGTPSFLG